MHGYHSEFMSPKATKHLDPFGAVPDLVDHPLLWAPECSAKSLPWNVLKGTLLSKKAVWEPLLGYPTNS